MLANAFKTPQELGLKQEQFDALVTTLVLMETIAALGCYVAFSVRNFSLNSAGIFRNPFKSMMT